ncbi:T9SS type A sorting domain-containing protein [Hymenobacter properus]|uniref:T9SS type A sorting domain-containing protein n=1 Tax=Hymenobacter properus TaxID=2791026 RepID=A0A931FKM1_9BACT|nr:T9SS type A sorting domain-containing protein [Hymenobacter properus]MBF9141855.1 T9SS type A sorting domain-containing protein [Hymenobacter properus]MBR7720663.1 T9SS type A sorting domain-containing protein [Microvirga sp. SRT04]
MRKRLQFSWLLVLLGLFFAKPAAASHMQGGDLTYASLGNNRYLVTLHIYRDCSGILPSSFDLVCRSGGCGTPATVTTPFVQVGAPVVSTQYCATLTGLCNATVTNTEAYTYTATVTLPPAAQWVLSTAQNARPSTTNITNPGDLYFEATLNNLIAGTTTSIVNNSPTASVQPAFFVPVHQLTSLSNNAFDVDGDSLVYSLETPLQGCGMPVSFASYPSATGVISTNPACTFQPLPISAYSAALPIFVDTDTVGTCPVKTGINPRFFFDARTGNVTLQPGRYLNTPSANGDNKYAASIKISEYRRINGRYVLVGTMRRELYFMVYDCGNNLMPVVSPQVTVQTGTRSTVQALGQAIPVVAGESVSVLINASDRNAGQALALTLAYNAVPGTTLQNLGNGQARLTFTPALGTVPGSYRVAVTAEDNSCPIKGMDTKLVTFNVVASGPLAARAKTALVIDAYPNPFTEAVQFQLSTPGVQVLTISDNLGRAVATVRSQPDGSVRWQPAATLPAGLYLARTIDGSQSVRLLRNAAN